jgi:hypothetical protein
MLSDREHSNLIYAAAPDATLLTEKRPAHDRWRQKQAGREGIAFAMLCQYVAATI